MKIRDFAEYPNSRRYYGGDGGSKYGILIDGSPWLIKFPKSTKDFERVRLSYTTTPVSEYLGSQIYQMLGIPVHETLLGVRQGKIVVACKDFLEPGDALVDFKSFKNAHGSDLGGGSSSGGSTDIREIIETIYEDEVLGSIPGVEERLWLMFVVDSLIGNNDRHNMNWGVIEKFKDGTVLAPVFDNGGAFFNKKDEEKFASSLEDSRRLAAEALNNTELAFAVNGKRIKPFVDDLRDFGEKLLPAIDYVLDCWDGNAVGELISEIPEAYQGMQILPAFGGEYYQAVTDLRLAGIKKLQASLKQ